MDNVLKKTLQNCGKIFRICGVSCSHLEVSVATTFAAVKSSPSSPPSSLSSSLSSGDIFWNKGKIFAEDSDNISFSCSVKKYDAFDIVQIKRRCTLDKESFEEILTINDNYEKELLGRRYKINYLELVGRALINLNITNVTGFDGCTFQCSNEQYDLYASTKLVVKGITKVQSVVHLKNGTTIINDKSERQTLNLFPEEVHLIGCQLLTNQPEKAHMEAFLEKKKLSLKLFNTTYEKEKLKNDVNYWVKKEFFKVEGLPSINVSHNNDVLTFGPALKRCTTSKLKNQTDGRMIVCEVSSNPLPKLKIEKDGASVNGSEYNVTEQMTPDDAVKFVITQPLINISSLYEFRFENYLGVVSKRIQFRESDADYDEPQSRVFTLSNRFKFTGHENFILRLQDCSYLIVEFDVTHKR
ncbi:hypothetical protein HELRODRAFT_180461 [Helobdella robusta]|uniref:Uncharacterized protein n=1 Tax=Helobdella robusta TaxID=6412 RepID=T1FFY4_HELRO|nr:hypothetical protein HELRODRAFT_180461 [Helobdella robusta]ESN93810.1 hypothetical protein HELRODRAFT_180461 [Helobdella robusta]